STAREINATTVPYSGDRHPLVRPTARTMVSASIDSTAEPRKAAPNVRTCAYTPSEFNDVMQPGLYADDSITRRVNRENVLLLGGGRALLMQLAHPKVAAGVDEHWDFGVPPIRGLRRTILMTMAIVFGDRDTALGAARTVNQVHARVKGHSYRALDPELLLWVHATLMDTALVTYETFVQPLLPREREDFYQEFKLVGELLGVPNDRFPIT